MMVITIIHACLSHDDGYQRVNKHFFPLSLSARLARGPFAARFTVIGVDATESFLPRNGRAKHDTCDKVC